MTNQEKLDAFIKRAGFTYGWKNLESGARRMAEKAVEEIEKLEQQLDAARAEVEQAFREGFRSPATYNDVLVNDEDTEWENYKRGK